MKQSDRGCPPNSALQPNSRFEGLVDDFEIIINGLSADDYRISHGTTRTMMTIFDRTRLTVPVSDAGVIKIEQK